MNSPRSRNGRAWIGPWALVLALAFYGSAMAQTVELVDVLASTQRHHPQVEAALQNEEAARDQLLAARGSFDPYFSVYGSLRHGGYYELRGVDAQIRQATPYWGAEVYAGYRNHQGVGDERMTSTSGSSIDRFPSYYSTETLDGGEFRVGLRVPLLRGGPMDYRRAGVQYAEFGLDRAESTRQMALLSLEQAALNAYFSWVASGRKLSVAEELRELANTRQRWVDARVEAGAIAPIEALEAQRSVLRRESSYVSARRELEAKALTLALFYRDDRGAPLPPTPDGLPDALPMPEAIDDRGTEQRRAIVACYPSLVAMRADVESSRVSVRLAAANRLPTLDAQVQLSRDFGGDQSDSVTLPGTVFEGSLVFSVPLLNRNGRGSERAASSRLAAKVESLRLAEDRLAMGIEDVLSAHRAAAARHEIAAALVSNTRELAEAERRRFEAGSTSLFVVNQREQALAEAAVAEVNAVRALWAARARWNALNACTEES